VAFGEAMVSSYGTVRLGLHPAETLKHLHAELLSKLKGTAEKDDNQDRIMRYFNTTNVGRRYEPYLTIARFQTLELAQFFRSQLGGLNLPRQSISRVWLADASAPPLRFLRLIGPKVPSNQTKRK
jgi:hypothetical protein